MPHSMRPDDEFKRFAYEQMAKLGKALSSPSRLVLLNILANGDHTVQELATCSGLTLANTSRHLQVLEQAHLARSRRDGRSRLYRLASDRARAFFLDLRALALASQPALERALGVVGASETRQDRVGRDELLAAVRSDDGGDCMLIDLRPPSEYARGHFPGSVNIPVRALPAHMDELPRDRDLIVYCRGRLCVMADEAVTTLRAAGFRARRTGEDVPTWAREGLPVEVSDGSHAPPANGPPVGPASPNLRPHSLQEE